MKMFVVTTAFLSASISLWGSSGPNPAAQQLLVAAEQQADIFRDPLGPFQLEVDFTAQLKVPTQGHLTLKWASKDRWWSKVAINGFEQIRIQNGEMQYTSRNLSFTPARIVDLNSLLHFAQDSEGLIPTKEKNHVKEGVEMTCLAALRKDRMGGVHEICVNAGSLEVLSDQWQLPAHEWHKEAFTDYVEFQGRRFPRRLELEVNESPLIQANVTSLNAATFDQTLLVVPEGAIERRLCAGLKPPVALNHRGPAFQGFAVLGGTVGETAISMTILTDGSVGDVQLMSQGDRLFDDTLVKAIKTWKFKPAMCGADPVVADMEMFVRIAPS
ncbi:MAG: TonB family protein [Terracidiphilus sp.]